jgi:hypothetical protein
LLDPPKVLPTNLSDLHMKNSVPDVVDFVESERNLLLSICYEKKFSSQLVTSQEKSCNLGLNFTFGMRILSRVYGCVTNNNGFRIELLDL